MGEPVYDLAHAVELPALLIQQFVEDPAMAAMCAIFGAKVQELEDALWQLYTLRGVSSASGAQLDLLGRILNYARGSLSDVAYAVALRSKILLNTDSGTTQQILSLMYAAFPGATFTISENYPASFTVKAATILANPTAAGAMVQSAKPAGVNAQLVYSTVPLTNTFTYCDANVTQPVTSALLGLADSSAPGTGGHYAGSA